MSRLLITYCLLLLLGSSSSLFAAPTRDPNWQPLLKKATELRFENPDSAIQELTQYLDFFTEKKDTLLIVNTLMNLATVYGNTAFYGESYNHLWKALTLAEEAKLYQRMIFAYQRIGRHYAFYKRIEDARYFLQKALDLNKELVAKGDLDSCSLTKRYMAFSNTYLELDELEQAQIYLDSCYLFFNPAHSASLKLPFVEIQQGFIYNKSKQHEKAIALLEQYLPWFLENFPSYIVIIGNHLGNAYSEIGQIEKSKKYYLQALEIATNQNCHKGFSSHIHEKLANLYFTSNQPSKAYLELKKTVRLDRMAFDSRSSYNQPILEIQDKYQKAIEAQEQLLKEKRLVQLEHDNRVKQLQNTISSIVVISLILFGLIFFFFIKKKYQLKNRLIKLEAKNNRELLKIKNKELTASALKLIEKNNVLENLKNKAADKKAPLSQLEINRLIKSSATSDASSWKAFEAQFLEVNESFFQKLKEKHPKLTQGEERLCALTRLKLTNREIAELMHISVESVHKSRYRLRKKLQLEKGVDLTTFLEEIG